jgi:hypothetical protein
LRLEALARARALGDRMVIWWALQREGAIARPPHAVPVSLPAAKREKGDA